MINEEEEWRERQKKEKRNAFEFFYYFVYVTLKNYLASYRLPSVNCIYLTIS
jgi:hypothetical protein